MSQTRRRRQQRARARLWQRGAALMGLGALYTVEAVEGFAAGDAAASLYVARASKLYSDGVRLLNRGRP